MTSRRSFLTSATAASLTLSALPSFGAEEKTHQAAVARRALRPSRGPPQGLVAFAAGVLLARSIGVVSFLAGEALTGTHPAIGRFIGARRALTRPTRVTLKDVGG
jgi:hypothetical protein